MAGDKPHHHGRISQFYLETNYRCLYRFLIFTRAPRRHIHVFMGWTVGSGHTAGEGWSVSNAGEPSLPGISGGV